MEVSSNAMRTILITLLLLLTNIICFSQIDSPVDTAKVRGIKKEYLYRKDNLFRPKLELDGIKEFDKFGRLIFQQIIVNNIDTPQFLNKYYYDTLHRVLSREHLMLSENKRSYDIIMNQKYTYLNSKLISIQEYEYGNLTGQVIYSDTSGGSIGEFIFYWDTDPTQIRFSRQEYYDNNGLNTKSIQDTDTNYYYYYKDGRDSITYQQVRGKLHSIDEYFYFKNKKITYYTNITLPDYGYIKTYYYNKKGNLKKVIDNMKGQKSKSKLYYYKNGAIKSCIYNDKHSIKQKGKTYYTYEYY